MYTKLSLTAVTRNTSLLLDSLDLMGDQSGKLKVAL